MSTSKPTALLVVADSNSLLPGEGAVKKRLEALDYHVEVSLATVEGFDVRDIALMVVSSSVKEPMFGEQLRDLVVPIIASSNELYTKLGMCRQEDAGEDVDRSEIEIIHPASPGHPMTANLAGIVNISSEPMSLCWARRLHDKAVSIAALPETSTADTQHSFPKRWRLATTGTSLT